MIKTIRLNHIVSLAILCYINVAAMFCKPGFNMLHGLCQQQKNTHTHKKTPQVLVFPYSVGVLIDPKHSGLDWNQRAKFWPEQWEYCSVTRNIFSVLTLVINKSLSCLQRVTLQKKLYMNGYPIYHSWNFRS